VPNLKRDNLEGAGEAAVELIASRNVTKVISGEFGAKVKAFFDRLKIQLIIMPDQTKTVRDILGYLSPQKQ
jgi:hypothetical protein